ncbi:MAG: hypothetical protein ACREX9_22635 [Gammaproteobacteria bacterium]
MHASAKEEKLSREEILTIIGKGAQRRLGMSVDELVKSYQEGTLEEPSAVRDLLILLDLLAEDDPIFHGRTSACK